MENRVIKFRAWNDGEMIYPSKGHGSLTSGEILNRYTQVMQFTGITDNKGVELFEGDIVKCYQNGTHYKWYIFIIKYLDRQFCQADKNDTEAFDCIWFFDFEIIGNIYENPKLIK